MDGNEYIKKMLEVLKEQNQQQFERQNHFVYGLMVYVPGIELAQIFRRIILDLDDDSKAELSTSLYPYEITDAEAKKELLRQVHKERKISAMKLKFVVTHLREDATYVLPAELVTEYWYSE